MNNESKLNQYYLEQAKNSVNFPTSYLLLANNIEGIKYIPSSIIPLVKLGDDFTPKEFNDWKENRIIKRIEREILDEYAGLDILTTELKISGEIYYYLVNNGVAYMFDSNCRLFYYFQLIKVDNSNIKDCPLRIKTTD